MAFWQIILIALAISIDAFSVAFAVGNRIYDARSVFRLSFHFGLFQALMPLLGWILGIKLSTIIGEYDHWIAFSLLTIIAVHMLIESLKPPEKQKMINPTRGITLVGLSISVSIDALGVGVGMGILDTRIVIPCIIYGIFTGIMSFIGIKLGRGLRSIIGRRVETAGALILFIVALHLLQI